MRKFYFALSFLFVFTCGVTAQNVNKYSFSGTSTGSFMPSGTAIIGPGVGATSSAVTSLGFDFYLQGIRYTNFSVNTNGVLTFDNTAIDASVSDINNATALVPLMSGIDGVKATASGAQGGGVFYSINPGQSCTITWVCYIGGAAVPSKWNITLYNYGRIEFNYGDMVQGPSNANYHVGFSNGTAAGTASINTATTSFQSAAIYDNTPIPSTVLPMNWTSPQTKMYIFDPNYTTQPTNFIVTAKSSSSVSLSWTDNASDETGYAIYQSTDNLNFSFAGQVGANVNSFTATGLLPTTTYYFRLFDVRETIDINNPVNVNVTTNPLPVSGTKTVGTGGDFATLTAAFAYITNAGLNGNMTLELLSTYSSAAETFPINASNTTATGSYQILIYPKASGLSITANVTTGVLFLNQSANITIDGRVNATGTTPNLLLKNSDLSGSGYVVRFQDNSSNNTFQYCQIQGSCTGFNGVVLLRGAPITGAANNDNNTFDHCNFSGGASHYFYANTGNTMINDVNMVISNCLFTGATSSSIYTDLCENRWTITGNRFYGNGFAAAVNGIIQLESINGYGFVISNNILGYATAAGTGKAIYSGKFWGINVRAGGGASYIDGNIISGLTISNIPNASTDPAFAAIRTYTGTVHIGTVAGNTIGAATGNGDITITAATNAFGAGIYSLTPGTIENNTIGSIQVTPTVVSNQVTFSGILAENAAAIPVIRSNNIGSATTASSIRLGTDASSTGALTLYGIRTNNISAGPVVIGETGKGNTIQNIACYSNSNSAALYPISAASNNTDLSVKNNLLNNITFGWSTANSPGFFRGIATSTSGTGITEIADNAISNVTLTRVTGTVAGYYIANSSTDLRVLRNTFSSMTSTAVNAYGMYYTGLTQGNIANNRISGITNTIGTYGIYFNSCANLVANEDSVLNIAGPGAMGATGIYFAGCNPITLTNSLVKNISGTSGVGINVLASSSNITANNNKIDLVSSTTGPAIGITINGASTTFNANKIVNVTSTVSGFAYGFNISGSNHVLSNNMVAHLTAPATSNTLAVLGVVSSATLKMYFNTIVLDGTSTGANYGSIAVYSSSGDLDLRNNVLINNAIPRGTGKSVALRVNSLTNYNAASNNNAFYAGTPSAANVIYYDGTIADQTLAAFQARVTPRDAASVTENTTFLSTDGDSPDFLHIGSSTTTLLKSAAMAISGFTTDIDGTTRSGTPDIGADEFTVIALPVSFTGISANKNPNGTNRITWNTAGEYDMSRYELQKSADGSHFSLLSTLLPTNNNGSAVSYMADDLTPFAGINYYRVKAVYSSGYEKYSAVVSLSSQAGASAFSVYPNPVEAHVLSIRTGHIQPGNYDVQLFNANGQCVYSNRISFSSSNEVKTLQLNNSIPTGIYRLLLSGNSTTPVVVSVLLK